MTNVISMSKRRRLARCATLGLLSVLNDRSASAAARVAAARALLEYGNGRNTARAEDDSARNHVEKIIKVDWSESTA